jgi:hypothetical protein
VPLAVLDPEDSFNTVCTSTASAIWVVDCFVHGNGTTSAFRCDVARFDGSQWNTWSPDGFDLVSPWSLILRQGVSVPHLHTARERERERGREKVDVCEGPLVRPTDSQTETDCIRSQASRQAAYTQSGIETGCIHSQT